jgi:NADPH-dependent curcumin reductase CurA
MISQYNLPLEERSGPKNMMNLFLKRLTMRGFIISDPQWSEKYGMEFFTRMSGLLKEGKIKTKEDVTIGIENAPQCYLGMFTGANLGKSVLQVSNTE